MRKTNINEAEKQIVEKQKIVDFDIKEFTIELIINKFKKDREKDENDIFIPSYQRNFVWSPERQSKFIESILLGLPIPYIFSADVENGRLEIVDGTQRIRTLEHFMDDNLVLRDLEILDKLNGFKYSDLPKPRIRKFINSTIRMITLSDKSDDEVRFLMFERINTGSDNLKDMEKRKGIYGGKFIDFVYKECSEHKLFKKLTKFTPQLEKRGEPQELIIRFFAYSDRYLNIKSGVNDFLNEYTKDMNKLFQKDDSVKESMFREFDRMLKFSNQHLVYGFKRSTTSNKTPRVKWDSISVGINLALRQRSNLKVKNLKWIDTKEYEGIITSGGQNAPSAVKNRIEYTLNKLLDS